MDILQNPQTCLWLCMQYLCHILKYWRYRSEILKANGFCVFVCSDFGGRWVGSGNPNVVQILKSVGKNGRSLREICKKWFAFLGKLFPSSTILCTRSRQYKHAQYLIFSGCNERTKQKFCGNNFSYFHFFFQVE